MGKSNKHVVLAVFILFAITRLIAETYRDWPNHKDFIINTTPTGANVASNLVKFPLLVRLTAADSLVFNQALANGLDIRFSGVAFPDTIGVHLPYQRELWDKTNKSAAFWVLVDTLKGNSVTQKIRMYWGNTTAPDSSKSSVVFDTTNGYQGVWHFLEGNNGTAYDATINNYVGTANGTTPPTNDTIGIIGRCRKFDGATSYFAMNNTANSKLNFPEQGTYSISTWVYSPYATNYNEIISKGDHQYALKINNDNTWLFTEFGNTAGWQSVSSPAQSGAWTHVVGVRNGAKMYLYVNGVLVRDSIYVYPSTGRTTNLDLNIGKWPDNAGRFFNGKLDEVEMSNVARSADWIKLCYENQKIGSTTVISANAIVAPTNLNYKTNSLTCIAGAAIKADTPAVSGIVTSWSITPALPAGLTINSTNGNISGTPTAISASAPFVITAGNLTGSTMDTVTIIVSAPQLNYKSNSLSCIVGTAIVADTPTVTGSVTGWSVTPPLPAGLTLSTLTGIIRGTPTAVSPSTAYVVTAQIGALSAIDTVTIVVNTAVVAPSISAKSGAVWAGVNSVSAKVWVKAGGTGPLTYGWFKNGGALSSATSDTLFLDTVRRADNNAVYKCIVKNAAGSTSDSCTLHVVAAIFSANPKSGSDTLTVAFIDSSIGSSAGYPLKRSWSFGDGATDTTARPSHPYQKPNTYTAKLTVVANGVADSMKQTITVAALPLKALFKADSTTAPTSLTATFTDLSTGTVFSRLWSFGDGTTFADTNTRAPVVHKYTKTGSDTVTLTVSGPAGSNTYLLPDYIFIFNPNKDNPIRLSGMYTAGNTISITFSNYSGLADAFPPPYVNKIELWSKKNGFPIASDTTGALPLKSYSLSTLKTAGPQFTDMIQLTGTYTASDSLGLMSVILWNTGARSAFLGANGTFVSLRDTVKPANNLVISGNYAGTGLVDFYLDSVSSLDPAKADSVIVQYDFSDTLNFSGGRRVVSVAAVLAQAKNNRYTFEISDPLFAGVQRTLYYAVSVKGVNAILSMKKTASLLVGVTRPDNPLHLTATTVSSSSILLSWPAIAKTDSIRIWYSAKTTVPLSYDISETDFLKVYSPASATSDTVSGLEPGVTYHFGAQVYSGNLWSNVTTPSSASAKTDTLSNLTSVQNTIRLDTAYFVAATNSINVIFTTDTTGHYRDSLDAGLSWSTSSSVVNSGTPARVKSVIRPLDTIAMAMADQVLFDTVYYVGLWLRKEGTPWAPPTDKSMGSLRTPGFTWQNVKYGDGYPVAYADDQVFRILIDTTVPYPTGIDNNTILRWLPPQAPNGFIPMSLGFEFQNKASSPPLTIGIRYGTLPAGHTPSDVRMYRFDKGLWFLDRSPTSYTNGYVSVVTRNISSPFMAMIDTLFPTAAILSKSKDSVAAGQDVADTFTISDNIGNVMWRFQAAKGGDAYDIGSQTAQDTGTLSAYSANVNTLIEAGLVSADQGVRAQLILDDGVHADTADVSRRVIRAGNSDVVVTDTMKWTPLRVTAQLNKPGVQSALKVFSTDSLWKYDITKFRLFRWSSYSGNSTDESDKWVEYSGPTDSMFTFFPGRVVWIKTRKSVTIDFGAGVTPDLTKSDTIPLQPLTWTDLALTHRFDVKLGDIFDASRTESQSAESLHVISYMKDNATGRYGPPSETYFYPGGLGGASTTMYALQNGTANVVYSVYNQFPTAMNFVIPPFPASMSKYTAVHKTKAGKPWVLKVSGRTGNGAALASVYCGISQGKSGETFFPPAPSLENEASIRVCNEGKCSFGYVVRTGSLEKDGGVSYDVAFNNNSDHADVLQCTVEAINGLPKSMRTMIVDPATGKYEEVGAEVLVNVSAHGTASRQLVMGTEKYLTKVKLSAAIMKLALVGVYPNPFKRSMRIRYSIPSLGLDKIRFGIFNASGQEVWTSTVNCRSQTGIREFIWDGKGNTKAPTAAGMYIVRMTAFSVKGAPAGVFERKIMYLP